jgi:hypothetical protein
MTGHVVLDTFGHVRFAGRGTGRGAKSLQVSLARPHQHLRARGRKIGKLGCTLTRTLVGARSGEASGSMSWLRGGSIAIPGAPGLGNEAFDAATGNLA